MGIQYPLFARSNTSQSAPFLFRQDWEGAKKKKKAKKQRPPYEAPNTLQSKATARIVELISQGEIGGLVDGAKSIFFDDVPLQNSDGTYNFEGVIFEERTGTPDQEYLKGFPYIEQEVTVGLQARRNRQEEVLGKTTTAGVTFFAWQEVYLDAPDKLTITPDPATKQTGDTYKIISKTAAGFEIEFRDKLGTPVVRKFDYLATGIANPVVQTIQNSVYNAVRVTIRCPAVMNQTSNGDLLGTKIELAVDVKGVSSDYVEATRIKIDGKNNSAYELSRRVELPAGQSPWSIRVRRITPDSLTSSLLNDTYWAGYTLITDVKIAYTDRAVVGLTLDASYFGEDIPTRSYEVWGRILQVPSNYDPETRAYDGIWDGTFKPAWSDNPVWVFYDLLTHKRYGLGRKIKPENVDKWQLYAIAKYCDELVDDGAGGFEPRYTFNGAISDQEDAYTVLNAISSSFMGMIYWGTDTVTAVQDSPAPISRIVNPSNVVDGMFTYSGTGLRARATVVYVTWNDPKLQYKSRITVVEDPESIDKWGYRQRNVTLVGCTSPGLAYRMGKSILESEKRQIDTVTYVAGFDHADTRPGDVVQVQDPAKAGATNGGRIVEVTGTAITLDTPVTLSGGDNVLYVVMEDGKVESKTITTPAASGLTSITVASAFSKKVIPGAMWALATSQVAPAQFQVLTVAETETHKFEITALQYDPTKYAFVDSNVVLPSVPTTTLGPLPAPPKINVWEYFYESGATRASAALFSWEAPGDTRVIQYECEIRRPGETAYSRFPRTMNLAQDVKPTTLGINGFRVRSMDRNGVYSKWTEREFTLVGKEAPPMTPTGFVGQIVGGNVLQLTWDPMLDDDLDFGQLRYIPDGATVDWNLGQIVVPSLPANATSVTIPYRKGTYLLKFQDIYQKWSEEPAELEVGTGILQQLNVVKTLVAQPGWDGVHSSTVVTANNELTLTQGDKMDQWFILANVIPLNSGALASEGIFELNEIVNLGAIGVNRVSVQYEVVGDLLGDSMADWGTLASLTSMSGTDNSKYAVVPLIKYTTDDPISPSAIWTDWIPVQFNDYNYWGAKFAVKLTSTDGTVRPLLKRYEVTVDMEDRVEGEQNVVCPEEGIYVAYQPAFAETPALVVECPDLGTDKKIISNETAAGFNLAFVTSADAPVAKFFNYLAKGYGRMTTS
jgi:predicted phage tail protein